MAASTCHRLKKAGTFAGKGTLQLHSLLTGSLRSLCGTRLSQSPYTASRVFYSSDVESMKKRHGLILGIYEPETEGGAIELSTAAEDFNLNHSGKLLELLNITGGKVKAGKARVFHGLDQKYPSVAVVGLGKRSAGFNKQEGRKDCKENVRVAVAAGIRALREAEYVNVTVDPCGDPHAAAEGAHLAIFKYDELKEEKKRKPEMDLSLWINTASTDNDNWVSGRTYAQGQNFARWLMEMPANRLTPSVYGEMVSSKLADAAAEDPSKLTIRVHQHDWIKRHEMGAFLSVAKGSSEPPVFMEISYMGGASPEKPLVLVGKGITFDSWRAPSRWVVAQGSSCTGSLGSFTSSECVSAHTNTCPTFPARALSEEPGMTWEGYVGIQNMRGYGSGGISLKPSQGMDLMRADMGGAAAVAGALWAAVSLGLPVNVVGLVPLCENMPSGEATKPGDVVRALNGKTIQVDNTDAEGRLILADALCYACKMYQPESLIDLATLTGAIDVALGSGATGVFSNDHQLWKKLGRCGVETGDRLWRMPLYEHYSKQVTESHLADVNNIGKHPRSGGSCTAAAFLKEFVTCPSWAHLDIAGVMANKDEVPYLGKGMSGRPVRTLIEFLRQHRKP